MADVTKIKLPDNSEYNLKDHRIPGVDTTPTSGSDNVVTSGGIYDAMTQNEYVVAAAINDLNDRLLDVEDSVTNISNTSITSETDPIFSASAAAGITASDITNWNSKTSNTGTLTGVSFNGVDASVTNGVASIAPYRVNLNNKYLDIKLAGKCVLQITTVFTDDTHTDHICYHIICVNGTKHGNSGVFDTYFANCYVFSGDSVSAFDIYKQDSYEYSSVVKGENDNTLGLRTYYGLYNGNVVSAYADITVLSGVPPLQYECKDSIATGTWTGTADWFIISEPSFCYYDTYNKQFYFGTERDFDTVSASTIVSDGGGLTGVSFNGSPATVSNGVASITATITSGLPSVSSSDNGKVLTVVSGDWAAATASSGSGTLDTTATTAQTASASESLSGSVTLHKVAKTGTYSDLIGTPTIPTKVSDLQNDSGFTTNTGTLTGVTFNGNSATVTSGVAAITATIPTVPTTVSSFTNDANYVKYVLCADETAYNAITTKDSGTLYLIPVTSS